MNETTRLENGKDKNKLPKQGVIYKLNKIYNDRRKKNIELRLPKGTYFRINVRPRNQFVEFNSEYVDKDNGIQQIVGKKPTGEWLTQSWIIDKSAAHVKSGALIADTKSVSKLLMVLDGSIKHIEGDVFELTD